MEITPYLTFNGQCAAAFKFYEQVLRGKITFLMTWGESPAADQIPPESHHLVMHATLAAGNAIIMGADIMPGAYEQPKGINVSVHLKDTSEGNRIFHSLAEKGMIQLPFQKTFWATGFGMCIDQFGIPWMINCEQVSEAPK